MFSQFDGSSSEIHRLLVHPYFSVLFSSYVSIFGVPKSVRRNEKVHGRHCLNFTKSNLSANVKVAVVTVAMRAQSDPKLLIRV